MKNVANILESIQDDVPQHAQPVLRDLAALVGVASGKVEEYDGRGAAGSAWHLRSEKVRTAHPCLRASAVCSASGASAHQ